MSVSSVCQKKLNSTRSSNTFSRRLWSHWEAALLGPPAPVRHRAWPHRVGCGWERGGGSWCGALGTWAQWAPQGNSGRGLVWHPAARGRPSQCAPEGQAHPRVPLSVGCKAWEQDRGQERGPEGWGAGVFTPWDGPAHTCQWSGSSVLLKRVSFVFFLIVLSPLSYNQYKLLKMSLKNISLSSSKNSK